MDFMTMAGLGSGLGSMLGGLFGNRGNKNPSDSGMPYLNQMTQNASQYYNPWIQQAQGMSPGMNDFYKSLYEDPSGALSNLGEGYKKSPGYQFNFDEAMRGIGNASAAGGMLGSPEHMQHAAEKGADIASKDYNQYLQNALGLMGTGLQGGENAMNRGFNATQNLSNINQQQLSDQASYAFGGQAGKNQQKTQDWANIFSGAGAMMPWLFGTNKPTWGG